MNFHSILLLVFVFVPFLFSKGLALFLVTKHSCLCRIFTKLETILTITLPLAYYLIAIPPLWKLALKLQSTNPPLQWDLDTGVMLGQKCSLKMSSLMAPLFAWLLSAGGGCGRRSLFTLIGQSSRRKRPVRGDFKAAIVYRWLRFTVGYGINPVTTVQSPSSLFEPWQTRKRINKWSVMQGTHAAAYVNLCVEAG